MKTYLITYQQSLQEVAYTALVEYIKTAPQWARPCHAIWLIKTDVDVAKIRDGIKDRIAPGDRVLVIEIPNSNWATFNVPTEVTDWMKGNIQ